MAAVNPSGLLEKVTRTLAQAQKPARPHQSSQRRRTQAQTERRVNPRVRAYGKARIDIGRRVKTQEDWDNLWKEPANPFPFEFGLDWKACFEYRVQDFAAEVGFLIDLLGLPVAAFGPEYAMLTSPRRDFYFAVSAAGEGDAGTPPGSIRLQFMISDLMSTVGELERRGISIEDKPQPSFEGSSHWIASFHTPHGIPIDLLGEVEAPAPTPSVDSETPPDGDENIPF